MRAKKLTLLVDAKVVAKAKHHSRKHGTSLSRMVSGFLASLPEGEDLPALTPKVMRLSGVLPRKASAAEYRAHLRRKHER